jgi:hypothetical protein
VVTDVAGDHDSKNQGSTGGDFGAPHCYLLPSGFQVTVVATFSIADCINQNR